MPFGDGVLTGRGTFQKLFGQGELRSYLEAELQVEAVPASLEGLELLTPAGSAPAARRTLSLPQLREAVQAAR